MQKLVIFVIVSFRVRVWLSFNSLLALLPHLFTSYVSLTGSYNENELLIFLQCSDTTVTQARFILDLTDQPDNNFYFTEFYWCDKNIPKADKKIKLPWLWQQVFNFICHCVTKKKKTRINSPTAKAKYRNTIKYVTQRGRSSISSLCSP